MTILDIHHGEYLCPSGLQFETVLGAGDGEWYAASRSGRFRQQMGAKRRKKRGIKQKAVLAKIYGKNSSKPGDFRSERKKEKSRNPHGYWIFRWRSGWDSNPRAREDYLISSQARYDHFDTAPYMLNRRFSSLFFDEKRLWKELTERTANYSVFRTG